MTTYNARRIPTRSLVVVAIVIALVIGAALGSLIARGRGPAPNTTTTIAPRTLKSNNTSAGAVAVATTPITLVSTTPSSGATHVVPNDPIRLAFSAPLAASSPHPTLSPPISGTWRVQGSNFVFTPSTDPMPLTTVTLAVPSGLRGIRGARGGTLSRSVTENFQIENGSTLRIQQLLSMLDYSPLSWTPSSAALSSTDTAAQTRALFSPPTGSFSWINRGWPHELRARWRLGIYSVFTRGLVMSFQADHGLYPNGRVTPMLWSELISAMARHSVNTGGYNYALTDKAAPEHLTIYHDGKIVLSSSANTGISSSPTPDGTYPVYTRLRSQVMRGTNPNGQSYADLVQFVAYFHGNDAVHYMDRADYGIPQSLGCIELPLADAAKAWPYLAYGTLVTVIN